VKETERHAKAEQERGPGGSRNGVSSRMPADLEEALAAASDALTAATGREVKVKQTAKGYRAEIAFESPADAVELAERLLRRPS
jgi:hypothetical protein